jgi:hypothetical protein
MISVLISLDCEFISSRGEPVFVDSINWNNSAPSISYLGQDSIKQRNFTIQRVFIKINSRGTHEFTYHILEHKSAT